MFDTHGMYHSFSFAPSPPPPPPPPPVKVPQILKILHARSVENLSYLAFLLELAAVTFTCTYNYAKGFPFRYITYYIIPVGLG